MLEAAFPPSLPLDLHPRVVETHVFECISLDNGRWLRDAEPYRSVGDGGYPSRLEHIFPYHKQHFFTIFATSNQPTPKQ